MSAVTPAQRRIYPGLDQFALRTMVVLGAFTVVAAAQAAGATDGRIMRQHVLPGIVAPLLIFASMNVGMMIVETAGLSFIGLGVPPPTPTWGQMIRDGTVRLADLPLLSLAPGAALLIAVFAFNLVGDGLRDMLDPRAN